VAKSESFHDTIERHRREGFGWRYDGFGDWTTEAIFAKLAELGIASDSEQFRRDAMDAGEPRVLSEAWAARVQTGDFWQDFPLLVPEELWRRLLPDVPYGGILFGDLLKTLGDMDAPSADPVAVLERAADLAIRFADLARTRRPEAPAEILREWEGLLSADVQDSLCDLPRRLQWEGLHAQAIAVTHACVPLVGAERMLGGLPLVLAKEGKRAEAEAQIAQNEREMPGSFEIRMGSAEAWEELGDIDHALRAYEEAERLAADKNERLWAVELKADCLEAMGSADEAREVRKRAGLGMVSPADDDAELDEEWDDDEESDPELPYIPTRRALRESDETSTEELLGRLGVLGLPGEAEAVREAAIAAGSPGALARAWHELCGEGLVEAGLHAAPYILWERLLPERPCAEATVVRLEVLDHRIAEEGDRSPETLRAAIEASRRLLELDPQEETPGVSELAQRRCWPLSVMMLDLPGRLADAGLPDQAIALTREWRTKLDAGALDLRLVDALVRTHRQEHLERLLTEDGPRFLMSAPTCLHVARAWEALGEIEKALRWAREALGLRPEAWRALQARTLEFELLDRLGRTEELAALRRRQQAPPVAPAAPDESYEPPPPLVAGPKVGRNDPCPCGSGKKYKKCCGK